MMLVLIFVSGVLSVVHSQLPPYVNCTRYLEPCVLGRDDTCCGYPFYECINDGTAALCQSILDFPELSAELLLRLREAKDRGDPEAAQIRTGVLDLLGPSTRRTGGGGSGGSRQSATTPRGRATSRPAAASPSRSSGATTRRTTTRH